MIIPEKYFPFISGLFIGTTMTHMINTQIDNLKQKQRENSMRQLHGHSNNPITDFLATPSHSSSGPAPNPRNAHDDSSLPPSPPAFAAASDSADGDAGSRPPPSPPAFAAALDSADGDAGSSPPLPLLPSSQAQVTDYGDDDDDDASDDPRETNVADIPEHPPSLLPRGSPLINPSTVLANSSQPISVMNLRPLSPPNALPYGPPTKEEAKPASSSWFSWLRRD